MKKTFYIFSVLLSFFILTSSFAQNVIKLDSVFYKEEYRIPMRDGVKLFTSVYIPRDTTKDYPILLWRTPYSVGPYGKEKFSRRLFTYKHFVKEGYIIVFQDVRGKFMSEGQYVNMRPFIKNKKPNQTDEATDTYDTVDWLIKNVPHNNGKVGIWGISYPGFYAAMGAMSLHPAIKAVSPQAPICDWFIDDDMHHNGALTLLLSFNFFKVFGQPRDSLTTHWPSFPAYPAPDDYKFFLRLGSLKNVNEKYFHGKIDFWNKTVKHGSYDDFWKSRSTLYDFDSVKTAVMTVGGWFDSEDLYGALHTYDVIEKKNPGIFNVLVMGPWSHGAWSRGEVSSFGQMNFGENTSEFYREKIELPFFNYFLKGKGKLKLPEALVFETGKNKWRKFSHWPPKNVQKLNFYLDKGNKLNIGKKPVNKKALCDTYLSDPNRPVPYTAKVMDCRAFYNRTYPVEDQRFASRRPDVLVYESEPLKKDVTIAGPIDVNIFVSTTGTDADWVVKLIDVFPDDAKDPEPNPQRVKMGGFEMLIRGDIFRGKFRTGYDNPKPFVPGKVAKISFQMQDVFHCFLKGHKIMVQIQSSWFPLFDRNPQTFTDIYNADEKDFVKAYNSVYHSVEYPSSVTVNVLKENTK